MTITVQNEIDEYELHALLRIPGLHIHVMSYMINKNNYLELIVKPVLRDCSRD